MTCVVGYFRMSHAEVREDPLAIERLRQSVHDQARKERLKVEKIFIDHYGVRRVPFSRFVQAVEVVQVHQGLLVLPTLGAMRRDPLFLERLYNASVPFVVLDDEKLSRRTILASAMSAFRTDKRRSEEG